MKDHGTAPAFSIAPYKVSQLFCPQCRDLIIAATKSQHVSTNEVRHWWACESCGYEFRTTVRWQSSPPQSVSAVEETVPQSLQGQRDHCPDGISSGV
jgi:DNA-directed RNA polymerase subunit M/transcription elongation factor TFIIS